MFGGKDMFTVRRLRFFNLVGLLKVSNILYDCGKDMAKNNDLHHWNNSHIKNWIIVALCVLKNKIYIVCDDKKAVATFQTRKVGSSLLFQKLATSPASAKCGIGSYCMREIEELALSSGCAEVLCEVYEKSEHAISFYEHRGYRVYDETETLKYKEYKMRKALKDEV